MARYRLEEIFTAYLDKHKDEYPTLTSLDLIIVNKSEAAINPDIDWVMPIEVGDLESESFMEIEKFDEWYSQMKAEGATHVVLTPTYCRAIKNSDMSLDMVVHALRYALQDLCDVAYFY